MEKTLIISVLLVFSLFAFAQNTFELVSESFNSIDVEYSSAPSYTDLDGDGLLDMLIGEDSGHINRYEQNSENSTSFSLVTENFNSIDVGSGSAPSLTDLDGDGLLDILIGESAGNINHYEQNGINSASFHLVTENFNSIDVGYNSAPSFIDLDGDGLLDMLIGENNGNIYHYEQNGINSASFHLVTENFNSIHVGSNSAPSFIDLDGDGLLDMLIGEWDGSINHYEQNSENSTSFSLVTENFNLIDVGENSKPTFTDLDGDGLLDMLIGEYNGNINHYEFAFIVSDFSYNLMSEQVPIEVQFTDLSHSYINETWTCEWDFDNDGIIDSYENNPSFSYLFYGEHTVSLTVTNNYGASTKTDIIELPEFSLITENFNSIDVGEYSGPTFTDLDGDGLLDMLIGKQDGYIYHCEQIAENSTSFNLVTENFNSIDVGLLSAPSFTDLDGDGLLDMLIGELVGNIYHYEQIAENSTSFNLVTENFNSIAVGDYSEPTFTDLDGDSLLDMIIGEGDGKINHYEQIAENSTSFVLVTENFNSIDVGSYSVPTFTDLDGDGRLDMLIGERYGNIYHYVQNAENSTSFVLVTENFNSINVGQFSKPTFTDLNGNGLLDMLIGEIYGKIYHYEQNIHSITDFTLDHATGTIPLEVQFTDLSRLDVTNWQWDFDNDGNIDSYEQNPVYTYTETGTYTVSLTVSDEDNTYTETVTKNDLIATFIFSEFTLLSPSSYSVDIDIFPRLEWTSALSSRNLLPIYEVYISKSPIFTAEQTVIYETQNTYLYPSRDLELGTTYFWKVKATDHLGNEIWSNYNGTYWMLTTVYQTEQQFPMIDGLIADNRTLISENSPYWLSTEPHTAFNKDLTIESGVTLKFNSGVKLEIGGNLFIYGTVDDLVNIDGYSETSGRWHGIEYIYVTFDRDSLLIDENYQYISGNTMQFVNFNNCNTPLVTTADMYINSCNIENTLNGISQGSNSCIINTAISNWNNTNFTTGINGGKIFINNSITGTTGTNFNGIHSLTSNAVFDANIITYNGGYGIHGSSGVYTNNIVTNNGGFGIRGYSGDYLDNTVNENGLYGIYCGGNGNFTNNTVNDNGGDGIFGGSGDYIDNIVTNNGGYGIRGGSGNYTSNTVNENGEYGIWGVSGDYTDNTVTNNEGYGINGSSGNYSSNTVNENGLYGIHVDGNGDFTNNTVNENGEYGIFGGNGNYDNNTVNLNNGYGIDCGEVAVLNQNEVSNNGGFGIKDGLSFQNNIIDNNTGYGVQAFIDAILSDNTITNSGDYGLLNGVLIENNEISNNGGFGIDADEEATINNNVIHNNDGFAIHNGKIITNNTVTYNEIDDVLQINTDLINSNNIKQFSLNTIQNNILEEYLNDSEAYSIISFPLCDTLEFDNNIIENNETDDYCIKVSGNDLSITNNIIAEFIYSDSPEQNEEGVALWIEATGLNNIIDNNTIIDNGENYRDATIYIADADSLYITHNVISGNLSGGIYLNTGNIAITDNTITGNDIVGSASAIYLNGISAHSVIERNVITNNIGSYAIYGSPETFTQNNIFYNYSAANDTVLCNLRYTGTDQISYPYNFWGTRSDQGNIDPSIYDDNENGSIGMVLYQPILTAPSPLTPGQLTMIDTVVVTINGEELLPNTSGVADGQTVYLCLIGEDGNEFSVDLTEVNIINMTTFFPLQPLMWETGENTGIFRSEISISSTIYNPEQNIMRANAGDTLMISSVIDPSKVFYLPIIEMGFNMPESITINEDESFSLDMTDFITFPGNDEYLLFGEGNEFIDIAIDGMMVTFSPQANWNGAELITFGIDVQEQRYDYQDSLLVIINPVNDAPIVVSEIGDIVMNEDTNDNSIDLTEIFTDIDDDELAYSYSESTNISVEIAAGIVTLTPASDWFGEETMVFTATDSDSASISSIANVTVQGINDAPVIDLPENISYYEDESMTVDISQYIIDVDDPLDELIISISNSENINITQDSLLIIFSSPLNWHGEELFTFTIDDQQSRLSASDNVNVIVMPVNDPPVIELPDDFTFLANASITADFTDFVNDVDGDELSITVADNDNIIVDINGLNVTFSVQEEWFGEEVIFFTVSDTLVRASASDEVNIIVLAPPLEPILILPNAFSFNEDESLTINFLEYLSDDEVDSLSLAVTGNEMIIADINGTEVTFSAYENWFGSEEVLVTINGEMVRFSTSDNVILNVEPVNDIPELNMPEQLFLDIAGQLTIDLDEYAFDIDQDSLLFSAIPGDELEIEILGSLAIISSEIYWSGAENVVFYADDQQSRVSVSDTVLVIREFSPYPIIEDIIDVPDDQGGWVIVEFTKSCFDTDSLIVRPGEQYVVQYLIEDDWMIANSTAAFGAEVYQILTHTLQDSMSENPNAYEFRIIAAMEEGNFVSNIMSGYSLDNICPVVPSELLFDSGYLVWNEPVDEDFAYFSIYRDGDLLDYSTEPIMNIIGDSGDYQVTAVDCHANESDLSAAVSGGYPYGDIDHNQEVEAMDASLVLQYFCLIATDWEEWQIEVGDVDGNGSVEAYDAALILRYTVGIIDEFPVETITRLHREK